MNYRQRILVIRLSALGDVAILEPVLRLRAARCPDVLFLLAAPPRLEPLFRGVENIQFVPTQKRQSPRQLYAALAPLHPDMVADMHHVNRVIGLDWLFRLHGVPVRAIRKHRQPGRPSWLRYNDVLDRCAGMIMLHNSFTPDRFRAMSPDEFAATDTRLARLLRHLLRR